jgi:hypothetical protein
VLPSRLCSQICRHELAASTSPYLATSSADRAGAATPSSPATGSRRRPRGAPARRRTPRPSARSRRPRPRHRRAGPPPPAGSRRVDPDRRRQPTARGTAAPAARRPTGTVRAGRVDRIATRAWPATAAAAGWSSGMRPVRHGRSRPAADPAAASGRSQNPPVEGRNAHRAPPRAGSSPRSATRTRRASPRRRSRWSAPAAGGSLVRRPL